MIRPSTPPLVALAMFAASIGTRPAHADGKNEIRAVTFDETSGATRVVVRGAQTPTFTAYKLERPSRVVLDVPQARLAEAMRGHESAMVLTASTWAVNTIAAQQIDDGGQIVRVIISLARPGRYDVKTEGNAVVVMVTPRDAAPAGSDPAALASAQAETAQAKRAAATAEQAAASAQAEAERLRGAAATQVARAEAAQRAADEAKRTGQSSAAEIAKARSAADAAKADAARARNEANHAVQLASATQTAAEQARRAALADAATARQQADQATKRLAEAETAKLAAIREAEAAKQAAGRDATAAKQAAARDADKLVQAAAREAEAARADLAKTRAEVAAAKAEAAAARGEAESTKVRAAREVAAAKAEAEAARTAAAADKRDADKVLREARQQLSSLETKTAAAQAAEDKARAASAAASAREAAAQQAAQVAVREREAAAAAVAQATTRAAQVAGSERHKLEAEARSAEHKLAQARQATEAAERARGQAETAAATARTQLETSRSALASVEQQRTAAETAASAAARKRGEAEAAASDATRRRREAETAAQAATRERGEAEQQRAAAEIAARDARAAARAAEAQRVVAETAAGAAANKRTAAEASLAALTRKRDAAERAAVELETRSKAEAVAQAAIAAAQARRAGDAELAKARAAADQLASERKRAEVELADRRKAVATQQAEATRLETAAAQARDAANREEARRAQLAGQRVAEEKQLAAVVAQRTAVAQAPVPAPVPAAKAAPVAAAPVAAAPVAAKPVVAAAKPAVQVGPTAKVSDIKFTGSDGSGQVDIAITGDGQVQTGAVTATHAELIIDGAELAAKLERKLDVSKFGSPVRAVTSYRDRRTPNRVRLVAELAQPITPSIDRTNGAVRWRFAGARTTAVPPPVVGGFGATSTPIAQQSVAQLPPQGARRRVYRGATVDFDFNNAPLADLLRVIADTGRVNIVIPDDIDAKVTLRLKRVPWDQALDIILQTHGLWYRREGNLYRIAPRSVLDKEDEQEAARREAMIKAEVPRPDVVPLNYASAADMKTKLAGMLSQRGSIEVDERTNTLIITDVAGNRAQIQQLALQLDTQTPQISIEARIVEARSTFLRQLGVQWGGRALAGAAGGNATGLIFPSSIAVTGGNEDAATNRTGVATPSDFAVNLPAATGSGEGGAIGLSLGSVGGNFNINLRLSALEDTGTVRIISAPKITVLNNKPASIKQGVSIPISVISAAGTQTQFVQADLSLEVTPYVSQRDCAIAMNVKVTKNEPDFVNVGARGDPTILKKEATTSMLVADGDTSVLGGIYTRNSGLAYKKIPYLAEIPVLGWLFKNRRENDDRTEILVFITPKITNKGSLPCR